MKARFLLFMLCLFAGCKSEHNDMEVDVLIAGGGASGTMACIQAARLGSSVLMVEETPWLGGMLTAAGVSAIDGNYDLHAGLWDEFRNRIYQYYGGPDSVKTGWVSNILFEPQVGAKLLKSMVSEEKGAKVMYESIVSDIHFSAGRWVARVNTGNRSIDVAAKIIIDATELGDISKMAGIPYHIGMDARAATGEEMAPEHANKIIQDLTYVAILKQYPDTLHLVDKPSSYSPDKFYCTCAGKCLQDTIGRKLWDCNAMMDYGKLPNGHYMINWPIYGNDYYVNAIDLTADERTAAFAKAKEHTLCYVYYLQHELGFKHLGIADDVFPTADGLPFIPYHRESRRIEGIVRFDLNDLSHPFEQPDKLFRTGIAVGDYPVDHHHSAYHGEESLPDLHFQPVPSYSIPLGALIPKSVDNFVMAEKSISVTNLVNGTTRLQPVCMLIGQAAGVLAHLAAKNDLTPAKVPVRQVQDQLLDSGAFLLPYADISPDDPAFAAVQRIGATGILKGVGKHIGWKNFTYFYPDSIIAPGSFILGLEDLGFTQKIVDKNAPISMKEAFDLVHKMTGEKGLPAVAGALESLASNGQRDSLWHRYQLGEYREEQPISRKQLAVLLDVTLDPFHNFAIDHYGMIINKTTD